ncbi:GGDEF domain-containing protein [Ligilactobacillus agilis]|uniref:GGDEF domain-containing protein n=1 Tax=Ligilactobacillus agilis TaxID=1601 RepID=UPI0022E32FDE|nr:GGDEF domain-containing protein [Ligilactobacillus agilis]
MNGNYANISVRYIDQDANSTAFLLEVANLSQNRGLARSKKREEAMRFIYSLFDRVELINLSEGTVENLYRNNMHTSSILRGGAIKEVVDNYAQENIHPDDIAKFRKFYDENTMEERIKAEGGKKYITEYLRTKDENGHYCWKLYCVVPFPLNNNRMLLSCVFDVDAKKRLKLIEQTAIKKDVLSDSDGKISCAILWANLLAMSQFGVYWKDTDRRFIGANQTYLSYNSLKSEQELIGKREEELGWELNPDFRIDEDEKVLTEGEQVVNREGTMIVDGSLRNIATSKSPIYDTEGKIIGLMGYIIDITMESRDSKGLLNLAFTDLLTGILNRRGLMDALLEYEQMYLKRKADFVIAYVDVDNFTDFNDKNGRSYGDRLLSEVAYTLRNRLGKSCVVGRIGSDEFVLLKRVKDLGDASQLQALIRATVADIHQIGNKSCQVSASVGTALFSEVDNTQQLLRKADRNQIDFSLLFIDINGFKKYNDTYGHSFGDEVLRRVAACIRRVTGYTGVACRIGGDEFVIIHQDRNQNYIKDAENKLHQAVAEIEFIQKRPCKLELAMGRAVYSEVNDREELLRFADQRMYLNKQKRK